MTEMPKEIWVEETPNMRPWNTVGRGVTYIRADVAEVLVEAIRMLADDHKGRLKNGMDVVLNDFKVEKLTAALAAWENKSTEEV